MRASLWSCTRAVVVVATVGLAACADREPLAPTDPPHRLLANSSETLATGLNLTAGSYSSWNVSMPAYANSIKLSFDARINYSYTAGNSNVLKIIVNGYTVTGNLQKGSTYSYPNRGGTEYYYDNRGYPYNTSYYWGLFWSPDFVQNNTSTDYYYVSGGNAYTYVFDVTGLVSFGQVNTVRIENQGGWVYNATGNSPTVVLRDVVMTAS